MEKRLKAYRIGSYINLSLWLVSLILWILFGCLSQIATPKNMTFAGLFFVFLAVGCYSFIGWLFSKKAINAIETKTEYKNIHTLNAVFGLFYTIYPAILSKKENAEGNQKEHAHFSVPRVDFVIIGIALAAGLFLIDLVTKLTVINYFATHNDPIIVADGFLRVNYIINTAAAFGFGVGNATTNRVMYCVFAGLILAGIIIALIWKRKKIASPFMICLLVIASGALGNMIDRMFYSPEFLHHSENGVVDWIDFYNIWGFNFNIADCCVVLGAIALIIWLVVDEVRVSKANRQTKLQNEKVLSLEEKKRLDATKSEEENKQEKTEK